MRAFVGRINTKDRLQKRRSGFVSSLFAVHEKDWDSPLNFRDWLQNGSVGFGRAKEKRLVWETALMVILTIWLERNGRIFNGVASSRSSLWDRVTLFSISMDEGSSSF